MQAGPALCAIFHCGRRLRPLSAAGADGRSAQCRVPIDGAADFPLRSILASELVGITPIVLMESALCFGFDRSGAWRTSALL